MQKNGFDYFNCRSCTNLLVIVFLLLSQMLVHKTNGQMRQVFVDPMDADNHVAKISFYSPSQGYVAFSKWIGYTTDSGQTFTRKYITRTNVDYNGYPVNLTFGFGITGVKAFGKDTVLVYGDYGFVPAILYSTDQANSFKLIYQSQLNTQQFTLGVTDLVFPKNTHIGYAVEADRIIKTNTRGKSWFTVLTSPNSFIDAIEAVDDNTAFAFSTEYASKLLKTLDGGNTWQQISAPVGQINYVSFISPNKGWLNISNSDNDLLYYTSNGGTSWELKNVSPFYAIKMKFINDSTGYAISGSFTIIKTTDSGKIWEPLPRDNNYEYLGYGHKDLHFYSNDNFWAGGGHGFLEITSNGGGVPLPKSLFGIDTMNVSSTKIVNLVNYSKPHYQFKWYKNGTLISTSYHAFYVHDLYKKVDTISLIVINGANSDTNIRTQYFKVPPVPVVTSFTPATALAGANITIYGSNFTSLTAVKFGGIPATSFKVVSETEITAVVGTGATGDVSVINTYGTGTKEGFVFLAPPTISSFTPTSGDVGTVVTITGDSFIGVSNVSFGGINANSFTVNSATSITATVASGASGDVIVTSSYGTGKLPGFVFTPNNPVITLVNPNSGEINSVVTITGRNFSTIPSSNIVYFGAVKASVTQASSTLLKVIVPVGATYSPITVTTNNLTAYSNLPFIVTYLGDTSINSTSFSTKKDFDIGNGSYSSSITDIDGDGKVDYSVSNMGSNSISVLKNSGNVNVVAFDPKLDIIVGDNIRGHVYGDFDGDGRKDLAVTNYYNEHSVSIWKNTSVPGSISFAAKKNYPTREYPWDVKVHDLDGDGKPDLIVGIEGNGGDITWQFSVFRNTTIGQNISFGARQDFASGGIPMQVCLADIDDDKKPDIIIGNAGQHSVSILRNTSSIGHISFAQAEHLILEGNFRKIEVGDIDGDGKQDIACSTSGKVCILRNLSTIGNISFAPIVNFHTEENPECICLSDLNGDAKPDIIVCNRRWSSVLVFKNISTNGNIDFSPKVEYLTTTSPYNVTSGDFDGDGKSELAIAGPYKVSILKNNISEEVTIKLCSPLSGTIITSSVKGTSYQWQEDTGNGFSNINSSPNFSGANTAKLQVANIALSWNDYKYRCIVDGNYSRVFKLRLAETKSPSVTINSSTTSVCDGHPVTFTATPVNGGSMPRYEWIVDGGHREDNTTSYTTTYLMDGSQAQFRMTNIDECIFPNTATSNIIQISLTLQVSPEVEISASENNICEGTMVTFTAKATHGGSTPVYHWLKNGKQVGTNSISYSDNTLKDDDEIELEMISSATCVTSKRAVSNFITMAVNRSMTPSVTISSTKTEICAGQSITFTATPMNAGANPSYQWYIDEVQSGTNSPVFTTNALTSSARVKVKIIGSSTCVVPNTSYSNTIDVQVNPRLTPVITLSGNGIVEQGQSTRVYATVSTQVSAAVFQWQDSTKNHSWGDIALATHNNLLYTPVATGDKVRCVLKGINSCNSLATVISEPLLFTINNQTSIDSSLGSNGVHAYPNPVTNTLVLDSLKLSDDWKYLEIRTLSGNKVFELNISGQTKVVLSVSQLKSGMYIGVLRRRNGGTVYFKFLKV